MSRLLAAFVLLASWAAADTNVVLVVVDDAGYVDFGFTGCEDWRTPHIDRLASEGVVCTQGYVSASVCSPSRAGMLTGRYQQRFGHEFNLAQGMGLPLSERTIADRLGAHGYVCGVVGKWHLGSQAGYHPLDRGFDEFFGVLSGARSYWALDESAARTRRLMVGRTLIDEPDELYLTTRLGREAAAFIDRHADQPFFLYLPFTAVHTPMHAREVDLEAFDGIDERRRTLAAMTVALDDAVGHVLDALDRHGLADDTLVIFINDNGGATNNASDNGAYRGMKGSKFEGGVRVPFVLRWPARLEPGQFDAPVISLDLAPTALAAVGAEMPAEMDGVDLAPFITGEIEGAPHQRLYWRRGVAAAIRDGDWKLIRVETNPVMLFDLARDPGERTNVAADHPEVVADLLAALSAWEGDLAEPLWTEGERWRLNQIRKHRETIRTRDQERELP